MTAIAPDARYTVVRRDADGYRTTPRLTPMTLVEAEEEATRLQIQYRDQRFVILCEIGEPTKDDTITVRPVGSSDSSAPLLRFPARSTRNPHFERS